MEAQLDLTPNEAYPNEVPQIEIRERVGELSETERKSILEKLLESVSQGDCRCLPLTPRTVTITRPLNRQLANAVILSRSFIRTDA